MLLNFKIPPIMASGMCYHLFSPEIFFLYLEKYIQTKVSEVQFKEVFITLQVKN